MKIRSDDPSGLGAYVLLLKDDTPLGMVLEADLATREYKRILYHGPVRGDVVEVDGLRYETGKFDYYTVMRPESHTLDEGLRALERFSAYVPPAEAEERALARQQLDLEHV